MKWAVVAGFLLCFIHDIHAGVTRCIPGSKDEPCSRDVRTLKKSDLLFGKECLPGTKWISQCNECICNDEGEPSCTDNKCEGAGNEQTLHCAPETIWKYECNTCWCTSIGQAMCTRIGCNTEIVTNFNPVGANDKSPDTSEQSEPNSSLIRKTRATSQASSRSDASTSRFSQHVKEPPKTCQPGQEFRMDCNKCLCDNEGQDFSCTRIDCNALNNNNNGGARRKREVTSQVTTECTPGSVFEQGCKVCRCSEDGRHAICPTHCKKDKEHSENDISNTESDPSFRCNPGEQYKRFCNDCTCSADGRSVFCTLRLCDEEMTPTI